MKRAPLVGLLLLVTIGLLSCVDSKKDDSPTVARINDYRLTLEEFDRHIAEDVEMDDTYKVTRQAKQEVLEALIRQQILIQEAKRRNLDTRKAFIEAIQRYWESTLIRNLLDIKGQEINDRIYVSEEAIEERYREMKQQRPALPPLKQIAEEIEDDLREEKKTRLLEAWIEDLKKETDIEINAELIEGEGE